MISREKLNNIHKLESHEILQIFHECEEALGLSDMDTASMVLGISKRRIYQLMNNDNSLKVGIHRMSFINLMIK